MTTSTASAMPGKPYRAGTLEYTRMALLTVFFWILWGDCCLMLMEAVIPTLAPLTLKAMGVSTAIVGLLIGSIPNAINLVLNPVFSTWSDRYRGRLGRRRPFLLWATPMVTVFLILIGFSGKFIPSLYQTLPGMGGLLTQQQFAIVVLGVLLVGFSVFNLFIITVFFYLVPDVVPQRILGKFYTCFRIAGLSGGFVFNQWILKYADRHPEAIYMGAGLLYMIVFLLLVWRVKEGEHPPPVATPHRGLKGQIRRYLEESFAVPFYRLYFFTNATKELAVAANVFMVFLVIFAKKDLGLTMDEYGKVLALGAVMAVPMLLLAGVLSDRFHPIRVVIAGGVLLAASNAACFFLIHDPFTFKICIVCMIMSQYFIWGAQAPLLPMLLARHSYGQLSSANGITISLLAIPAPWICGKLLDILPSNIYLFLWGAVAASLATGGYVLVYRRWLQLGGDKHYTPPTLATRETKTD